MVTTKAYMTLLIGMVFLSVIAKGDDECCKQSEVKTLGNGQVSVNADVASIYAYIMADGVTVADAQSNADAMLEQIYNVLKQNDLSNSSIQTSYLSIYPTYNYSTGNGVVNGYTVYISLTINIEGIDQDQSKLGTVIEGLVNSGISSISGTTYDVIDKQTPAIQARKAAFANALKKAKQYVDITNGTLGKLLKIDESSQTYYPYSTTSSYGYTTQSGLGTTISSSNASKKPGLLLPEGQVTIDVQVVVTWILNIL